MNENCFRGASQQMADGMARICRLYGVSPLAGRLYSALFLTTEPLSLESLAQAVGVAKSTASVALRKLEGARVVRRLPPRLDRRDHYEVVADPWLVLADWSRLYFTPELEMWRETTGAVLGALDAPADPTDAAPAVSEALLRERLAVWRSFIEVAADLVDGAVRQAPAVVPARRIPIVIEEEERE